MLATFDYWSVVGQILTGFFALLALIGASIGVMWFNARKKFNSVVIEEKDSKFVALSQTAKIYEDLYLAEKESNARLREKMAEHEKRIITLEEQANRVTVYNQQLQEKIRINEMMIVSLRQRLDANKVDHSDIK